MAQERMRDIIIQLKAIKESKNLTIQNILDTLDRENQHLAKSTVIKVFSEGGEDLTYQYDTIRTLADVMFRVYSTDEQDNPEIKGLKSTIQLQNIMIDQLKEQLETERRNAEETASSCYRRIEFLRDRVEKQDVRIEQKDRLITIMLMQKYVPNFDIGNGMQKYFEDTLAEVSEYLGTSNPTEAQESSAPKSTT